MEIKKRVGLWELADKKVYVRISAECANRLFECAIKHAGSKKDLAILIGDKRLRDISVYTNQKYSMDLRLISKILESLPDVKRKEFIS